MTFLTYAQKKPPSLREVPEGRRESPPSEGILYRPAYLVLGFPDFLIKSS